MNTIFDVTLGVYVPKGTPFDVFAEAETRIVSQEPADLDVAGEQPAVRTMISRRAEMEEAKIQKELAEVEADKVGELWTMQAALKRRGSGSTVFVLCKLGSHLTNEHEEAFSSQHPAAILTLDPMHIIGKKSEVMATVGQMWKCDEYAIRFID